MAVRQTEVITFRMSEWLKRRIEQASIERKVSMNNLIRGALVKDLGLECNVVDTGSEVEKNDQPAERT